MADMTPADRLVRPLTDQALDSALEQAGLRGPNSPSLEQLQLSITVGQLVAQVRELRALNAIQAQAAESQVRRRRWMDCPDGVGWWWLAAEDEPPRPVLVTALDPDGRRGAVVGGVNMRVGLSTRLWMRALVPPR